MPTLLLNRSAIKTLIKMPDVINVVEESFRMYGESKGSMPAKTYPSLEKVISGQCPLPCQKETIVVVDDLKQASTSGEINVPIKKRIYNTREVYGTLAELVVGKKKGRTDDSAITVFDSTGIAVEDIAVAKLLFEKAQQTGGYPSIDLIRT